MAGLLMRTPPSAPRFPARPEPSRKVGVLVSQRTFKRRETAIEDQLEIAELALAEEQRRQSLSLGGKLGMAGQIAGDQVLEDAAVGRIRHVCARVCVGDF